MTRRLQGRIGGAITFLVVAALVIGGLGWVSWSALRVEKAQREATAEARLVNQLRVALWRLDSGMITPLGFEDNRPYDHYTTTCSPLNNWVGNTNNDAAVANLRVPSPLITCPVPNWMALHFQVDAQSGWTSPQVPTEPATRNEFFNWADVPAMNVTDERARSLSCLKSEINLGETLAVLTTHDSSLMGEATPLAVNPEFFQETVSPPTGTVQPTASPNPANAMAQPTSVPQSALTPPLAVETHPPPRVTSPFRFWGFELPARDTVATLGPMPYSESAEVRIQAPAVPAQQDSQQSQLNFGLQQSAQGNVNQRYNIKPIPEGDRNNGYASRAQFMTRSMSDQKQAFDSLYGKNSLNVLNGPPVTQQELALPGLTAGVPPLPSSPVAGPLPQSVPVPTDPRGKTQIPVLELPPRGGASSANPSPPPAVYYGSPNELNRDPIARDSRAAARVGPTWDATNPPHSGPAGSPAPTVVHLGAMRPQWIKAEDGTERLALIRAVRLDQRVVYQGVLLDWEQLQAELKEQVKDLFPEARLVPVRDPAGVSPERVMTALPVQLDPGPSSEPAPERWSPLRIGLALAWAAALIALAAVGLGGWSLLDLSERRIRFVSAVTHELRTPLTSLRLYLDLLTSGMIADEAKKAEYLQTLNCESDRLHRLIDNVLNYARLENRSIKPEKNTIRVGDLLQQIRETWQDRCAAEARELLVVSTLDGEHAIVTDSNLVQQIVGNLIDNARKYSKDAEDKRIWLWARPEGPSGIVLEVEDRGPGIPQRERASVFRPFRRGETADTTAGGAGLGLALARQWATALGGRLAYRTADGGVGACFRLELT